MKTAYFVFFLFSSVAVSISALGKSERKIDISNLLWKMDENIVSEACVDDIVQITFDVINIPRNKTLKINIFEKNDEDDDFVAEIDCLPEECNSINWTIEFDEYKYKTSAKELEENGYTKPEYYFIVKCDDYISEKSNIINIYGFIDISIIDKMTGEKYSNKEYRIFIGDGMTKYSGITDENGKIQLRNVIIGDRYIMIEDAIIVEDQE
jgi:hypothetical protein